jgi:hypothetical protein
MISVETKTVSKLTLADSMKTPVLAEEEWSASSNLSGVAGGWCVANLSNRDSFDVCM